MIINDNQWYRTKLVFEIFLWYNYPCQLCQWYLMKLVGEIYLCTSDTSDTSSIVNSSYTSNTTDWSDASKTSASVTRLSSYFSVIPSLSICKYSISSSPRLWATVCPLHNVRENQRSKILGMVFMAISYFGTCLVILRLWEGKGLVAPIFRQGRS